MATSKKKRKSSSTTATTAMAAPKQVVATPAPKRVAAAPAPAVATPVSTEEDLAEEYQYVRKDLRQLTVVSAVLFIIMLGAGLFI
jgi:hypothetical protein